MITRRQELLEQMSNRCKWSLDIIYNIPRISSGLFPSRDVELEHQLGILDGIVKDYIELRANDRTI